MGSLAMAVLYLCTTDVCRMGRKIHPQFILGRCLLSAAAPQRRHPSDGCTGPGIQVDTDLVSLLGNQDAVRWGVLPEGTRTSRVATSQTSGGTNL